MREIELWKQHRNRILREIEERGFARFADFPKMDECVLPACAPLPELKVTYYDFHKHRYFDNAHGREIVEVRCGDICVERLSP